ncbi:heparan-alpha-glucosaminide N-acetyltransferase domain-containing protein [Brachybacterium tyrofermentans]|uniref:heparan-alpha-glucosaminide N-acetyltransferase domain-containing protein n=1 Tax=Brachybacterium tyrofermentans TaxID=47848 RepID=UPI003FD5A06F
MTSTPFLPEPDPVAEDRSTTVLGTVPATTADPSFGASPDSTHGPGPASDRIEALDLVRLLAIIGMMTAHLLAPLALMPDAGGTQGPLARVAHVLTEGPSSTLFAVIGGCSLVLATRRRLERGDRRGAVASVMVRGACVTLIGLLLELLPSSVMVVLVPFGLAMMITAPLLLVPTRLLVPLIAVLAVGGRPLAQSVPGPVEFGTVTLLSLGEPLTVLRGIALTGQYPLITWVPYLLLGVVLMRCLLRVRQSGRTRRAAVLAAANGTVAAVIGYILPVVAGALGAATPGAWHQAAPHTGTLGDMLATGGVAVALIAVGFGLLPPGRRLVGRPARILRSAGAAPLTLYVIHVALTSAALIAAVLLSGGDLTSMPWYVAGLGILTVHLALTVGLGAVLAARGGRGPLEALLARVGRRLVRS